MEQVRLGCPRLHALLQDDGIVVYHTTNQSAASKAYLLPEGGGIVFGQLFSEPVSGTRRYALTELSALEAKRIRKTAGRRLCDRYWGRYVAAIRGYAGQQLHVLRDPTGALPCFITRQDEIYVIFSHLADCIDSRLVTPSIDFDHVTAYLWHHRLVTRSTGLTDVHRVMAGECLTIAEGERRLGRFYWLPQQICRAGVLTDKEVAKQEVRDVLRSCVAAWSSLFNKIMHMLSGGLDSAVVLACLPKVSTSQSILCHTYFTRGHGGDERAFSRRAAARARVPLIESPLVGEGAQLEELFQNSGCASPADTYLLSESKLVRDAIVRNEGIQAVFSGQGGDHFFQQARTSLIAADFLWCRGRQTGFSRVLNDTARLTRLSLWSVLRAALAAGLLRRPVDPYGQVRYPLLLSDEARDSLDRRSIVHPWLEDLDELPSGKLLQIFHVIDSQHLYREPETGTEIIHPLVSQPIIELCLRIPSYVLTYGARDRALIRDAFADDLPPEIRDRQTKGTTISYFTSLLIANRASIRARLLDGQLVRNGILNRNILEASLQEAELTRNSRLLFPLLDAINAELWLQGWRRTKGCTE